MLQYLKFVLIQLIFIRNIYNEISALDSTTIFIDTTESSSTNYNKDDVEDSFLETCELAEKYGYLCEKHIVETEDGYLLEMHRFPKSGAQPVLLMHGLLSSSSSFILMGPDNSLAYLLFDMGYDVWIANVRGTTYSRKHKNLYTFQNEFWKFSFDEIGKYDLPAIIDYILGKTPEFEKMHYVGYSQGSMVFWILCHYHPEYIKKILSMQAIAPAAFLSHCKSPIIRLLLPLESSIQSFSNFFGIYEFLPNSELMKLFMQKICKSSVCENTLLVFAGYNEAKINKTMLPIIASHCPAGTSIRQIIHYLQLVKSGYLRNFDLGLDENRKKYGQDQPPDYDLSKVKTKVAIYYSENDWLTTPEDVEMLISKLPNVIRSHIVADKNYNHIDFIWAMDAKELVFEEVISTLRKVEKDEL